MTAEQRALLKQKRIAVFGSFQYVVDFLRESMASIFDQSNVTYFEVRLKPETAPLAKGYDAVCIFVSAQDAAVVLAMLFARCTRMCGLSISARSDVSRLTMHHAEVSQRQRAHALPSQTYFSDR